MTYTPIHKQDDQSPDDIAAEVADRLVVLDGGHPPLLGTRHLRAGDAIARALENAGRCAAEKMAALTAEAESRVAA